MWKQKTKFLALNSLSISFLSSLLVPSILIDSSIFLSSIVLADEVDDDSEDEGEGVFTISTWSINLLLSFCIINCYIWLLLFIG